MHFDKAARGAADIDVNCGTDPVNSVTKMFVDIAQANHIKKGERPALRAVFRKVHGVAYGSFRVRPDLPDNLKVGLLAGTEYPAWVRFSSDTAPINHDYLSTVGIGIKLFNTPFSAMVDGSNNFDIILQNFDVFFVPNATEMCAFTKASLEDHPEDYLKNHPKTAQILADMAQPVGSVLATSYWSCLPYCFGDPDPVSGQRFVKYKLESTIRVEPPATAPADPAYLGADAKARLAAGDVTFKLYVQFRNDPAMSLDDATDRWDESKSPPVHVADLILWKQDIAARGQPEYGENLSMNIWRVPPIHGPVGSIAEIRLGAYRASAVQRHDVNGIPDGEPARPRPQGLEPPPGLDQTIVRAAIHPAIGIARIGDSKTDSFIGPEVVAPAPEPSNFYRDAAGAIKRQVARFRIYGYNAEGEVVRELTPDNADIEWTVHLANKKAQWYQFQAALDIPEAVDAAFDKRNANVSGDDRIGLAIDPGPRSIGGKSVSGPPYQFDTGKFVIKDRTGAVIETVVPLGEIRTDDDGHLLVFGGTGNSASPTGAPVYNPAVNTSFNNADQWYDDVSDGPVTATVSVDGKPIPVEASWVAVAPPNYAPDIISWRTMYDLLVDVYVECGWMQLPQRPSFTNDIFPMLQRLSNLQWVNAGFAAMYGKGRPMNFDDNEFIGKLAQAPSMIEKPGQKPVPFDPYEELRRAIFHSFRPPEPPVDEPVAWSHVWPWIYGDAWGTFTTGTGYMLTMTPTQTALLKRWADGDFENDWPFKTLPPDSLAQVPLAEQPAMLDKAALHYCLADTFHPGCELTWPMRHASMYTKPFRIRHRAGDAPEPDYGPQLTPLNALQVDGPLYGQAAGDLTRWMALPWQGDTAFCRSGYDPQFDPYVPTFWAARVPNQILTEEDYTIVMDATAAREERLAAFNHRAQWLRKLLASQDPAPKVMLAMIAEFGTLGIIEARPGIKDDPDFPEVMFVETLAPSTKRLMRALNIPSPRTLGRPLTRLEQAGWASEEQLREFRSIRVRHE